MTRRPLELPTRLIESSARAVAVVERLRSAGFEALWAGGCVRDLLVGKDPKDFDVATSAHPPQVQKLFKRTISVGESFGVVRVLGRPYDVEVATFRSDGQYVDGRRPTSVTFANAELDAQRRDFTINGLFYDPISRELIDYVGGERDLDAGIIRAIGNPADRIAEDKLRMLRAIRFTARFGFSLDDATRTAIIDHASEITSVSAERIFQEVRQMLEAPSRVHAIEMMSDTGLSPFVWPDLRCLKPGEVEWPFVREMLGRWTDAKPIELILAAIMLLDHPKQIEQLCARWKTSNELRDRIEMLLSTACMLYPSRLRLAQARIALSKPTTDLLLLLLENVEATHRSRQETFLLPPMHNPEEGKTVAEAGFDDPTFSSFRPGSLIARDILATYGSELPPPILTGDMLMSAGWKPSPLFKTVLSRTYYMQLDGLIESADEALAYATRIRDEGNG